MNRTKLHFIHFLLLGIFLTSSCKKDTARNNEQKELQQLMVKIKALAATSKCGDNIEMLSIAVGEKACGGPKIYVPYTNSIDVNELTSLAAKYTSLEKTFNKKWNVVSDCALAMPPKSVTCQNGKLIVEY
jgi:hypothetical protein